MVYVVFGCSLSLFIIFCANVSLYMAKYYTLTGALVDGTGIVGASCTLGSLTILGCVMSGVDAL